MDTQPAIAGGSPVRTSDRFLVFGRPALGEEELAAALDCLRRRWPGTGPKAAQFEQAFVRRKGGGVAVAVSSGTAALHLALMSLGVGAGDEVITSAMTFGPVAHAIVHTGATPVLADCDPWTFNVTAETVAARITPRTRAILVVHMCGRCCDMDPILALARRHGLLVIEDCAHAIEARYRGRPSGLLGDAGCFSFYVTKNATAVEGGLVLTGQVPLERDLRELAYQGMSCDAWQRLNANGYRHYDVVRIGFKYNMPDLHAAIGLAQLDRLDEYAGRREAIWRRYDDAFADLPVHRPPPAEPDTVHARHLYTPLLDLERLRVGRDDVLTAMLAEGIGVGVHFVPVHRQTAYAHLATGGLPNADFVGERTLSLPLAGDLSEEDVEDVCKAFSRVLHYYGRSGGRPARYDS